MASYICVESGRHCKAACLEGKEKPHHLVSVFASLVKYIKKKEMREMGRVISLLLLTIVWCLMVGLFKAQDLASGLVHFKSRKTALAHF